MGKFTVSPVIMIAGIVALIATIGGIAGLYLYTKSNNYEIKIEDGNVVKTMDSGESEILVDKDDYVDINEFLSAYKSPDGENICFIAQMQVPQWLYISDTDGSNVQKIDSAKNCVWSHNSEMIAFTNHTTDVSPINVLMYNLNDDLTTNFTRKVQKDDLYIQYQDPSWSDDDKYIYADYTGINFEKLDEVIAGTGKITVADGWVEEM